MACKRKDVQRCHCYWEDDLSGIIDKIFAADALIIGTPIYFGDITSQLHTLLERLRFVALSYDTYENYFKGEVKVGIVLTMNITKQMYKDVYESKLLDKLNIWKVLNGSLHILPVCDTLQVNDYEKYSMASFSEYHKKEVHDKQFPIDLKEAFQMGASISKG